MTIKNAILLAAATATMGAATVPATALAQAKPAAAVATDPDLRCATWAMVAGGQEKDQVKKERMGIMMSYFMGRYEARTGGKIEAQIKPATIKSLLGNIDDANKTCIAASKGFGMRLGATLKGMQPAQAAAPAAAGAKTATAPKANPQASGGR